MSFLIEVLPFIILVIAGLSVATHFAPFKVLPDEKPAFAVLPKYKFELNDQERFRTNLEAHNFNAKDNSTYVRGTLIGDFVISLAPLQVKIMPEGEARIGYRAIGVLFDTGDLFTLAKALKGDVHAG